MRILYVTQWFEPEPNIIKGIGFVRALMAAGHDVTVVTGYPNYPTGRLYPGYRMRPIGRETVDGVRIVRLPLYPSHDASSLRRSLNFLSFFVSVLLYVLFRRTRYDVAYVYHPPITVGLAVAIAGPVRPLPFVLDVQDLWPDTIAATGMAGAERMVGILGALCQFVYARAAAIVVQAEGMRRALIARGVPATRLTTIHNWASAEEPAAPASAVANRRFSIVYAGNLGRAQGMETVVDAAAMLGRRDDVEILLYGDGIEEAALHARAARSGSPALRFMGRVPGEAMPMVFAHADALLLHIRDEPLFTVTIPSKIQAYLAQGLPIVAGIAGDGAAMLDASGAAIVVPPGDATALAAAMAAMADLPPARRATMGAAGRRYYRERLSFDAGLLRTIAVLRGIHPDGQAREGIAAS